MNEERPDQRAPNLPGDSAHEPKPAASEPQLAPTVAHASTPADNATKTWSGAQAAAPKVPTAPPIDSPVQIPGVTLISELGRGGMGVVYRGKQKFLDREVAVKLLLEQTSNTEFQARFKREAKLLAALQHPSIVACYQADITSEGVCFLIMEFVDGPNLRKQVATQGPLTVEDAVRVCRDIATALQRAYEQKIIHRDVKSENVLLARDPNASSSARFPFRAKLTDLGLARPETPSDAVKTSLNLTQGAAVMGTPSTMSPEQFDDPLGVDHRTDIYGLGCAFYDTLTGKPAFPQRTLSTLVVAKKSAITGRDPRQDRPDLPEKVAQFCMRMLAAAREDRPQNYEEVIRTCDELLGIAPSTRAADKKRSLLVPALGIGALVVAAGTYAALRDSGKTIEAKNNGTITDGSFELHVAPVVGAREGTDVKLSLSVVPSGAAITDVRWKQLPGSTPVVLTPVGNDASFLAPLARANYPLSFRVEAKLGAEKRSAQVDLTVAADDAPPTLSIDGPRAAHEGQRIDLRGRLDDTDGHGQPVKWTWKQVSGPTTGFSTADDTLECVAPEAAANYTLEFTAEAEIAGEPRLTQAIDILVQAVNAPPQLSARAPTSVDAGDVVTLDASVEDVDSLDALNLRWTQANSGAPNVHFENALARTTTFVAPEKTGGDYELRFSLEALDGNEKPVRTPEVVILVHCDPKLAPLPKGLEQSWMPDADASSVSGWNLSSPAPTLPLLPDTNGFALRSPSSPAWISRPLPRGSFALTARLVPPGGKMKSCGLRLSFGDRHALNLCFLPLDAKQRTFAAYDSTASDDGTWPTSPADQQQTLASWPNDKAIEFEAEWTGARLAVRWRDPESSQWSAPSEFRLSARPKIAGLFVDSGQVEVQALALRGL